MQKDEYRTWAKEVRTKIGQEKLLSKSNSIEEKIRSLDIYKKSSIVMSYLAKDIEVSLNGLFEDDTKNWYLPVVKTLPAYEVGEARSL